MISPTQILANECRYEILLAAVARDRLVNEARGTAALAAVHAFRVDRAAAA
jgi:hypothetical protein